MHAVPLPLLAFVTALAVSLLSVPVLIRRHGTSHVSGRRGGEEPPPVPRIGGIAVLAGLVAGVAVSLWWSGWSGTLFHASRYQWIGWIVAGGSLFVWGLVDDLRGLSPRAKFAMQLTGALVVYAAGFRIDFLTLPGFGVVPLGWAGLPVTVLWVVSIVNAFNFIDGLDGLASAVALISAVTIAAISFVQGVFPVTVISSALAGSLVGFLRFNVNPARITLGDSGSQLLGFTLAVISMRGLVKGATAAAVAPALVLGLPILDMGLVLVRRALGIGGGEPPPAGAVARWKALSRRDREHIHHNLLDLGLSPGWAVAALCLLAAAFCASAVALVVLESPGVMLLMAVVTAGVTALLKVTAVRRRPQYHPPAIVSSQWDAAPGGEAAPRGEAPRTEAPDSVTAPARATQGH